MPSCTGGTPPEFADFASHSHSLRICIDAGNPIINSIIGQYAHRFLGGGGRRTARAPRTLPRFARGGGHQADSHAHANAR